MIRRSVVAGSFYPGTKAHLAAMIEEFFQKNFGIRPITEKGKKNLGVLCPHAGYVYSGSTASYSFFEVARNYPDTFILIGPNHTGMGSPLAIQTEGSWETPLGASEIDHEIAKKIFEKSDILDDNDAAFRREHSLEVQLPFIQYLGGAKIVPICMAMHDLETSKGVGKAIAETIREDRRSFCILASSDLTHFGSNYDFVPVRESVLDWMKKTDMAILGATERLDVPSLFAAGRKTTACGIGCIATMVEAKRLLGAKRGRILKYTTSADVSGSLDLVVGYGSFVVE